MSSKKVNKEKEKGEKEEKEEKRKTASFRRELLTSWSVDHYPPAPLVSDLQR